MTYLGRDGRQYVVISTGGHGAPIGPPLGAYLVAFALPKASLVPLP
jgi:quinoprotein glucose dehydrogenase